MMIIIMIPITITATIIIIKHRTILKTPRKRTEILRCSIFGGLYGKFD